MLTLIALLERGSQQPLVRRMASILNAAALLNMAPILVGLTTVSRIAILLVSLIRSVTSGIEGLLIAERIPPVRLYPVIADSLSCSTAYTDTLLSPDERLSL